MQFLRIQLHNIFSHSDTVFDLDAKGLCLIKGSNGAGKSSILKALLFVLYGIGADSVVNNRIGKDTYVILEGEKSGVPFAIQRYRKHKTHKNSLYLTIGSQEVAAATNTEMQKKIEAWIGCDYRAFLNIASFSSGMLMFANATDVERKAIFEKILQDLDTYNNYHEAAKEEKEIYKVEIDGLTRSIEVDERELEVIGKMLEDEEKKAETFEEDRAKQVEQAKLKLEKLREQKQFKEQLNGRRIRYTNALFRLDVLLESVPGLDIEAAELRSKIQILEERKDAVNGPRCPTCKQEISEEHLKEEHRKINNAIKRLETKLEKVTTLRDKLDRAHDKYDLFADKRDAVVYKLGKYMDIETAIEEAEMDLNYLISRVNEHEATIKTWRSKTKSLHKRIARLKTDIKTNEEQITYLDEIIKGFSKQGIPNVIIARALSMLEEQTNSYLDILTNGALSVDLQGFTLTKKGAVRNKIGINVISNSGVTEFESYSGGERQRLNIALLLALRDVAEYNKGIKMNCLFLDEVLDLSLDEEGIEEVLGLLALKKESVDSIIVISPKEGILFNTSIEFDTVHTISKETGFSRVT